jgi:glucokinase
VIVNGTVIAGPRGLAGEIGHLPVVPDGERCVCGQLGCTEVYASARGLARRYTRAMGGGADNASVRAEDVIRLAREGDADAARVFGDAITVLALALVSYTLLMDPLLVVLGGGLADAGDELVAPLAGAVQRGLAWRPAPRIVRAEFGADAGRVGAALLAWSCPETERR